jgi:hypothetical protein
MSEQPCSPHSGRGNYIADLDMLVTYGSHKTCLTFITDLQYISRKYMSSKFDMPTYNVYHAFWWQVPSHQAIFVETGSDCSGELYHVVGSMAEGFKYETKRQGRLESSRTFSHKVLLGKLESNNKSNFVAKCRSVPAPGKTVGNPLEDNDCKKWVRQVIAALKEAGTLSD